MVPKTVKGQWGSREVSMATLEVGTSRSILLIGTITLKDIIGSNDLTDYFARNQHFKREERSMKIACMSYVIHTMIS